MAIMEEQSEEDTSGGQTMRDEEEQEETLLEAAAQETEEEDVDALPHSEILDIFEEGLARLVQDPLLCDLPIQVLCPSSAPYSLSTYLSCENNLLSILLPSIGLVFTIHFLCLYSI